jgi:hypothetical protein
MEVKVSQARQRLERIKIEPGADTNDDEVSIIRAHVKAGSSADQATAIDDSEDEYPTSSSDDSDVGSVTTDSTAVGSRSPSPDAQDNVPPLDQLPPDSNCKLYPFHQLPPQDDSANLSDNEDSETADMDARSDTSFTIIGDDQIVENVGMDPPEHIGGYPIQQRRILTPVSQLKRLQRKRTLKWQEEQARE